jgi:hypothetical protein
MTPTEGVRHNTSLLERENMDDTLSIMEDMLLLMAGTAIEHSAPQLPHVNNLIDRVRDIRKQQEQDCLQEAEDTYECLQQDEDGTQQREDYLYMRYPHAQGD